MGRTPDISFRPYIGLNGLYNTGFTGVVLRPDGSLQNISSLGLDISAGVYGMHRFKHSVIGLNYSGDYQHFPHNPYGDGTNQMLTLQFDHQVTRHLSFDLTEAAGTYTRNYLYSSGAGLVDPQSLVLPTNDLFDNRVIYGQTSGGVTYRASSRLSFRLGGAGYLVRRRSSSLYGVTGYTANGDVSYRLTRFVSLSGYYGFEHFGYTRAFGASDIHMGGLALSARLSRTLELGIQAGEARVETLFLTAVRVDPVIAAITGQATGIQATYNVRYVPTARVRLTKQMQTSNAEVSYIREISPGNGVYLTSRSEAFSAWYSYRGQRHWNFSVNAGYNKMSALAQTIGVYGSYSAGLGVSRDIGHGLQWSLRADERHVNTNYANFKRYATDVSMGFYWSPGEVPLSLW
jgi:hypothetical protein